MRLPTRLNFLFKFRNVTFYGMISASQSLEGIMSRVSDNPKGGLHIILLDLEGCELPKVIEALKEIQRKYQLSDFWITSDAPKSFRAWCFSVRPWTTYLRIMLDLIDGGILDYNFFFWSVKRGSATLRTSNKVNRQPQEVVAYLPSPFEKASVPEKLTKVVYDTGLEKRGLTLFFPFKRALKR